MNKLQQCATDNFFRSSKTKTVCMYICQKRGLNLGPQRFPVVETKYLGVILDRKLSFVLLKYVKKKGMKALTILNVIGNTEWGAGRKVMLNLYRSLVRSKLDYGCIVLGVQIYVYNMLPRSSHCLNIPTHDAVIDNKYMKLFDARSHAIRTLGRRNKQYLTACNIEFLDILETTSYFMLPPWCIRPPKIILDLMHVKKDRTYASSSTFCANTRQAP